VPWSTTSACTVNTIARPMPEGFEITVDGAGELGKSGAPSFPGFPMLLKIT
jgi:hypothetical protein